MIRIQVLEQLVNAITNLNIVKMHVPNLNHKVMLQGLENYNLGYGTMKPAAPNYS